MNLNLTEVEKFDSLATQWWDKQGEFRTLHDINPLRANWIDNKSPVAGKRLLDVGCGGGILCESLAQRGADVIGIDAGKQSIKVANLHKLESGLSIDYFVSTAEDYAQKQPKQFDIVTCLEMLEHVPEPSSVVDACAKLVKPGGTVFFSTINRNPKSYFLAILGAEYILKLLPVGTHNYSSFIRPSELASWLRKAKLEVQSLTGLEYDLVRKRYRLNHNNADVNYMIYATKPL